MGQVRELDDCSMRQAIFMVAAIQKRHYVIMEVKSNLIKEERQELLARFTGSHFKKSAFVLVGDPNIDFKKRSHQLILNDKQAMSDKAFELKKIEEKRKKEI